MKETLLRCPSCAATDFEFESEDGPFTCCGCAASLSADQLVEVIPTPPVDYTPVTHDPDDDLRDVTEAIIGLTEMSIATVDIIGSL